MFAAPSPSQEQHLSLLPGQTTTISLSSNPTTGYSWKVVSCPEHIQIEEGRFQSSGGAIGAGGTQNFIIHAISPGTGTLTLRYSRSWEASGGQTKNYNVEVV